MTTNTTFQEKSWAISEKIVGLQKEMDALFKELYSLSDGFRYVGQTYYLGTKTYTLFNFVQAAHIAYNDGEYRIFTDNPDGKVMLSTTVISVAEMDELIASNKITF